MPQGQLYMETGLRDERGDKYDGIENVYKRGSIDQTVEAKSEPFTAQAISEIPGLSHAAPERPPRGTLSPQGPLDVRSIFCFLVPNVGWFPELTPVRSQAIELWLTTLEAGDIVVLLQTAILFDLLEYATPLLA